MASPSELESSSGFELVFAEFVASARRAGLELSPVEAMDVQRAAMRVGLADRDDLRRALSLVMVKHVDHRAVFERVFEAYFRADGRGQGTFFDRLRSQGFSDLEIDVLDETLRALGVVGQGGGDSGLGAILAGSGALDRLLTVSGRSAQLGQMQNPMQVGFFTARLLDHAGVARAQTDLRALRGRLRDALGDRGDVLAEAIAKELDGFRVTARKFVQDDFQRRNATLMDDFRKRRLEDRAFVALEPGEVERVLVEVRRLADRIRGALAVRRRRERRGSLDVRATLRRAYGTGGIPFRPVFRRRRRDRPKLVVLCDISDSVRSAARFLLVFAYAIQSVFRRTRSFVFVSELGETTELFEAHPVEHAIALAYSGQVVSVAANSNYGRVFADFAARHFEVLDKHTTVLVIGDGRNNYNEVNAHAVAEIRRRSKRVVWMNPEPRGAWGFGDSAMPAYLPHLDRAMTVHNLESLRDAVRELVP